jgi:hypothetical protein
MTTNLDRQIARKVEEQRRLGGINMTKLETGNRVEVKTLNSVYTMTLLENGNIMVHGGEHIPEPVEARLIGSTWGTPLIKQNWIGKGMRMEIVYDGKKLLTSAVQGAKVIGDVWLYELWT